MNPDLTKLQSTSLVQSFKNNRIYSGSFTISGTWASGSIQIVHQVTLPANVTIADIIFQGRADGGFAIPTGNPRPNSAWFKRGVVNARVDMSGFNNQPQPFMIGARIDGNVLTITATAFRTYTGTLTISPEVVQYKVIDYSVF